MPAERAAEAAAAPSAAVAPVAAPPFLMVGADDAGACVDGVCALPTGPSTP